LQISIYGFKSFYPGSDLGYLRLPSSLLLHGQGYRMRHKLPTIRLTFFAMTALGILWLSLDPNPYLPKEGLLSWDKAQHALAYAVLTLLGGWALLPLLEKPLRAWRLATLLAVGYGVLLELAQALLTRYRRAQMGDALADALGALAVYFLAWLLIVLVKNRKQRDRI
jgi:VanZ family protein